MRIYGIIEAEETKEKESKRKMAILSVSRKTDIPAYFSEWFFNRLNAGEIMYRSNPYKPDAVTRAMFNKRDIDCIVFWTKNPAPMLDGLHRIDGYKYYFQFTLTGYGSDIEPALNDKNKLVETFRELSKATDKHVVWRYDPIVFTKDLTMEWHLKSFARLANSLAGFTDRCVISFVDMYGFVEKNMRNNNLVQTPHNREQLLSFCRELSNIANQNGMNVFTCAEAAALEETGIQHGSCIDKDLIEKIVGYPIKSHKDKGQREACLCAESVDVGKYDTCGNGCKYCYACKDLNKVRKNLALYDPDSPILCDTIEPSDVITEKRLKTLRTDREYEQLSLF